jgi:DNA topoisomerase-3
MSSKNPSDFLDPDELQPDKDPALEEPLGSCPLCGENVYERNAGYFCENNAYDPDSRTCDFVIWRKFMGKTFSRDEITRLLNGERIVKRGLKSKRTGSVFDAPLELEGGRIVFKFPTGSSNQQDKGRGDSGKIEGSRSDSGRGDRGSR